MNILLIGFKAVGKTTLGKLLSLKMGLEFIDMDNVICKMHSDDTGEILDCRKLYLKYGEEYFRNIETKALKSMLLEGKKIIAVGAGAIEKKHNREILKNLGKVIYLKESKEKIWERIVNQGFPPFFDVNNPRKSFEELFLKRTKYYEEIASIVINCDGLDKGNILSEIVGRL